MLLQGVRASLPECPWCGIVQSTMVGCRTNRLSKHILFHEIGVIWRCLSFSRVWAGCQVGRQAGLAFHRLRKGKRGSAASQTALEENRKLETSDSICIMEQLPCKPVKCGIWRFQSALCAPKRARDSPANDGQTRERTSDCRREYSPLLSVSVKGGYSVARAEWDERSVGPCLPLLRQGWLGKEDHPAQEIQTTLLSRK